MAIVPQGGNTGLVGGQTPDAGGQGAGVVAETAEPHPRGRRRRRRDDRRSRRDAGRSPGGGRSALGACSRCRSPPRAAAPSAAMFRRTPAAWPCFAYGNTRDLTLGIEVGFGRRAGRQPPFQAAQGQHRLQPQGPVRRRRGHAGDRHRGVAEAVRRGRARARPLSSASPIPDQRAGAAETGARALRPAGHQLRNHAAHRHGVRARLRRRARAIRSATRIRGTR